MPITSPGPAAPLPARVHLCAPSDDPSTVLADRTWPVRSAITTFDRTYSAPMALHLATAAFRSGLPFSLAREALANPMS